MNLFRQQKFSIRKFNVGIFSALIATVTFISTNPTTASAAEQNQPAQNQPAPIHSLTQMLVLKLILQHSQLHLPTKDNQQYNQQTKVDRLIQQEEQHNQIHNQLDKVIKLIRITLHKHNLEIKQHRQTKQVKEITKQHLIIMQHRQIKHSQ